MRSCFRRELSAQKNIPSGSGRKNKRKYIYFDSLLFLLPFTVVENNESSIEIEQSAETLNVTVQSSETGTTDSKRPKTQPKSKTNCYDEEYLEILREGNQLMKNNNLRHSKSRTILGDMDEDESFLRSLLPYVKQFSSDQKLQLRIQLLQTVLNFKQSLSSSASIHNQTQQVLDIPNERVVIVTDPSMNSNMSNQYDTAERPSTEPPNYSDIAEDSEYVPRSNSLQNSSRPSGSSYTPSPVHRDYASIISPENESLFSLGDDDDVGEV